MKKILIVTDYYLPHKSGITTYIKNVINILEENNYKITVLTGNYNGKLKNSAALIDNGIISIVDKFHLPSYGVFDEARVFHSERLSGPIAFRGIRIGLMICEDMWFSDVSESLQESGAQILVVINGSPYDQNKEDERISVAVSRVVETNLPLIYVNQIGGQDELVFDGSSFIIDKSGILSAKATSFAEKILYFDIPVENLRNSITKKRRF